MIKYSIEEIKNMGIDCPAKPTESADFIVFNKWNGERYGEIWFTEFPNCDFHAVCDNGDIDAYWFSPEDHELIYHGGIKIHKH